MSFVDLMANDVWSDLDIDNRVQAIIRGQVTEGDELKAARLSRKAEPTPDDLAYVASVDSAISAAVKEGADARSDMALLSYVMEMETATRRLAQPEVEPIYDEDGNITNQAEIDADKAERAAAQAVMDNATPEQKELFLQRNPPAPEPIAQHQKAV